MTPISLTLSPAQVAQLRSQIHVQPVLVVSIQTARTRAGLSQDELAAQVDCSRVRISQIERGDTEGISLRLAQRIAQVLGYSIDQLFPEQ